MASENGYAVRTVPSAGPGPVLTNPNAYGAQLGAALDQFGQQKHNQEIRAYQIERQQTAASESASYASNAAKYRQSMDGMVAQLRDTADGGGAGHAEAVQKTYEAGRDALLAGITDDAVRQRAAAQFDEYGASLIGRESLWADGKRVGKLVTDTGDMIDTGANRVRTMHDQGAYGDELKAGAAHIDSLPIDADTKAKLHKEMSQSYAVSLLQGQFDNGQAAAARATLLAGAYDDVLDPRQKEALLSGADVEMRRDEAKAQQEQAQAVAGLREQIATVEELDRQGVHIDPAQISALRDQAVKTGDTSTAAKLDGINSNNAIARVYEGATPAQIEGRRAVLAGKAKRSASEDVEFAWLQKQGDGLMSQFRDDPVGYAMKYGGGPAPIDWADPASVQARAAWSRTYARASGQPVGVLSRAEASQLHENMAAGDKGRHDVLRLLDQMPAIDRATAARQIAPSDTSFQREAQLEPGYRQFVYNGRQKLTADRAFLTPDKEHTAQKQLLGISGSEIDFALRGANQGEVAATKEVAGSYLAGVLAAQGRNANTITPTDIRNAATVALGGRALGNGQYIGGIGHWAGGQPYVIADGFTEAGFESAIMRARQAHDAGGAGPTNPDGTPFNFNAAHPVFVAPGTYRWETATGGIVKRKDGAPYLSNVAAGR